MTETPTPVGRVRKRRTVILIWGLLVVLAIVIAAWGVVGGSAASRTVEDLLTSSPELNPVEATSELCHDIACVEGWRTDLGSYLRFGSTGEAEYWATVLGDDGRRFENIVLDLTGKTISFEQRRTAIDVLFAWHDWS